MSGEDLAKRLDRLEQLQALEKLINTYHWRADHFDWVGWADCFTEDAVFDLPNSFGLLKGRKNIHDSCKGNMDHVYDEMQHVMVNLDFELTGPDTAEGHGNLIFTGIADRDKPDEAYTGGGRYIWKFKKTTAGWRISEAMLQFLWNTGADSEAVFATK